MSKTEKIEIPSNPELPRRFVEHPCCVVFGCGRPLTRQESLFGNKCVHHQQTQGKIWPLPKK